MELHTSTTSCTFCSQNTIFLSGMQHPLSINYAERSSKLPFTFERRLVLRSDRPSTGHAIVAQTLALSFCLTARGQKTACPVDLSVLLATHHQPGQPVHHGTREAWLAERGAP